MRNIIKTILLLAIMSQGAAHGEDSRAPVPDDLTEQVKALRQSIKELKKTVETQQVQIDSLKQDNQRLRERVEPAAPAAPPPPAPSATPAPAAQSTLPEIGALIDIVGSLSESKEDDEGNDRLSVRELELMLGQDIDPFTRFNATIAFSDFEDVDVEEAYVTYLGLPYGILAKAGRLRPRVGIASSMHRDQLDTVDEPLVVQEYLGVEGLSKTGLELSRYLPKLKNPLTQEVTLGILEGGSGEGGAVFGETRRRPTYYAHLRNYFEMSDFSNLELGTTYLRGSTDPDARDEVNALGLDFALTHHFTPANKLKWQNELYFQSRRETTVFDKNAASAYLGAVSSDLEQLGEDIGDIASGSLPDLWVPNILRALVDGPIVTHYDGHPWGCYSLLDYRLSPRFGVGGRFDYVEPVFNLSTNPRDADRALSAYLTFYQSEFARLRLQYQHVDFTDGNDDDRVLLQGTYAVGVHKHQLK